MREALPRCARSVQSQSGNKIGHPRMIERRASMPVEHLQAYRAASKPVVITDAARRWRAIERWTDAYLTTTCGEEVVEVMAWRESDPDYEINSGQHRTKMRFSDYIQTVRNMQEPSNDFYITANNSFLGRPGTQVLFDDIGNLPYLGPRSGDNTFFWFGAGGTVTPLHHDTIDLILCQVRGAKKVTLIPATQTPLLYNHIGVYSQVDCESPDLERFPYYEHTDRHVLFLNPGEALFIPVGWWHHVRALTTSISVSFTGLL